VVGQDAEDAEHDELLRLALGLPGGPEPRPVPGLSDAATAPALGVAVAGPGRAALVADAASFTLWERCLVTSYVEALKRAVHGGLRDLLSQVGALPPI